MLVGDALFLSFFRFFLVVLSVSWIIFFPKCVRLVFSVII